MGEVYRARDTKLKREVAIKILPDEFSRDADRVSRFQREAQLLASLNHSNIAQIYGFDESGDTRCIVMEFVDGETLQERLVRGPIPVDETLVMAKQIAAALQAAHDTGVIHRDLKPANVKITQAGTVKVLDFGLAKAFQERQESSRSDSPTLMSAPNTGVILGTAPYMSPEQAKGRMVDKRSDVWAFGAVLYEMLTGKRAFDGDDVSDTLAAVLKGDPDWNALPADVPYHIVTLLKHCLTKDRQQRIADISVVQFLLNEFSLMSPSHSRGRHAIALAAVVLMVVLVAIAGFLWFVARPGAEPTRSVTRFTVTIPSGLSLYTGPGRTSVALSPDGTRLVYAARAGTADSQLYSRTMDQLEAVPVRGTEGGQVPFFSPDGQWIGFFSSDGKMKKVPVGGGTALTICDALVANAPHGCRMTPLFFEPALVRNFGRLQHRAANHKCL
jgi:serine/threonine-protein kinase